MSFFYLPHTPFTPLATQPCPRGRSLPAFRTIARTPLFLAALFALFLTASADAEDKINIPAELERLATEQTSQMDASLSIEIGLKWHALFSYQAACLEDNQSQLNLCEEVDRTSVERIYRGMKKSLKYFLFNVSPMSLGKLLYSIERIKNKSNLEQSQWRFHLHGTNHHGESVFINLTIITLEDGEILLQSADHKVAQGTFKYVSPAIWFGPWKKVAQIYPKIQNPQAISQFVNERKYLSKLGTLSKEDQLGLVRSVHFEMPDSSVSGSILQKFYDFDLFEIIARIKMHQADLTSSARLKIAKTLAAGLARLHTMGIVHADIKPENILLKIKTSPATSTDASKLLTFTQLDAVYADFGFSYEPEDRLGRNLCPRKSGTPDLRPPECSYQWPGDSYTTPAERAELILKGDVYSLGFTLKEMFNATSQANSNSKNAFFGPILTPMTRSASAIETALKEYDLHFYYHSLEQLLAECLRPNPHQRISASQLFKGMQYVEQKYENQDRDSKHLSASNLHSRTTEGFVRLVPSWTGQIKYGSLVQIEQAITGLPGSAKASIIALEALMNQPQGTYLFLPVETNYELWQIVLFYVNKDSNPRMKYLDVDSTDRSQIEGEIEFLKTIGVIENPITFPPTQEQLTLTSSSRQRESTSTAAELENPPKKRKSNATSEASHL